MTYRELYETATKKLDKSEITLGEYEEMTKPLDDEVRTWIPVGEKLPEFNIEVLVTVFVPSLGATEVHTGYAEKWCGGLYEEDSVEWYYWETEEPIDDVVIAWMEKPKSYEESEE